MRFDRRLILNFDWTLLILVLILCTIGVLNIFSASYSFSGAKANPFYIKQLQWVLIGFFCMSIAFCVDYRLICQYAYVLHGIAIFCLIIVFFYGFATHGSQRWISLGSFSLQPSELVKLTLILALAKYFDEHKLEQGYYLRELGIPFLLLALSHDSGAARSGNGSHPAYRFGIHVSVCGNTPEVSAVRSDAGCFHDACGLVFYEGVSAGEGFDVPES